MPSLLANLLCLCVIIKCVTAAGILYPQDSERRQLVSLDGFWNFRAESKASPEQGFKEQWYSRPLTQSGQTILMPVPSSYNDVTQDATIRDHIGWVWYDREIYVADSWNQNSVFVRFGSASHHAVVWCNGVQVVEHSGGYLPFQADISSSVVFGGLNRITVALNNTLTSTTLPQGAVTYPNNSRYPPGYFIQTYNFDFLNYAGIHRPVYLYAVSKLARVDDITITTSRFDNDNVGVVRFSLTLQGSLASTATAVVALYDQDRKLVNQSTNALEGYLTVASPKLWWARGMNVQVGYLYTLHVLVKDASSSTIYDSYRLRVGIRDLNWDSNGVYLNGKPVYFKGFGRHEDANIRGKGLDRVVLAKDFNLMRWIGSNSFRTSHYPYSEELMDLADEQGFMIIDEVPAVAMTKFGDGVKATHFQALEDLYQRDKNRPSVVMWSVANEPDSSTFVAKNYFSEIAQKMRELDSYRPVTIVLNADVNSDQVGQFFDVICVNRYYGWYSDTGALDLINLQLSNDLTLWRERYGKPIIVSEYGADTVAGLHQDPSYLWTEDFQLDFMTQYFEVFDAAYNKGYLIGEMIWNFADFATKQETRRVVLNRKGVFTRERQPKASARLLKERYITITRF